MNNTNDKKIINLTPKDITKMQPKDFIKKLEGIVDSFNPFIPNPYQVSGAFNVPYDNLDKYIINNKEVQKTWKMYTEKWKSYFFKFCIHNKFTEEHTAVQIATKLFNVMDISKRIPDIRITLDESFFIDSDYTKYKDEIKDLKNQIIELKKGDK